MDRPGLELERLYESTQEYEWIGIVLESEVSSSNGTFSAEVSSKNGQVSSEFSYIRTPALGYTAPSG